ncbi:hypothetical protein AWQ21_00750 [Picosynechococcus sp. PCC 7003]|nr:hypothetical protein AWQ21_00750 [Picosynechococcus sp. PCC 7003]
MRTLKLLLFACQIIVFGTFLQSVAHAGDSTFNRSVLDLLSNSSPNRRWSDRSTTYTTEIQGFYDRFNDQRGWSDHVQGITMTGDRRIVISHSLENRGENGQACGTISYSTPWSEGMDAKNLTWKTECIFNNYHPSVLQAHGNYIVATDNDDKKGIGNISVYNLANNQLRELPGLRIEKKTNSVGITEFGDHGIFLVRSDVAEYAPSQLEIYRAEREIYSSPGQENLDPWVPRSFKSVKCDDLDQPGCKWRLIKTFDDVWSSSSGMSLIQQTDRLVLASMFNRGEIDYIVLHEIILDNNVTSIPTIRLVTDTVTTRDPRNQDRDPRGRPGVISRSTYQRPEIVEVDIFDFRASDVFPRDARTGINLGRTQFESFLMRPSCRFGCSLQVIDGDLYYIAAARNISVVLGSRDWFEFSVHKVP